VRADAGVRRVFVTLGHRRRPTTVYETEVPGVGHKFELELDGDERLVGLVHHDGKREVYHRPDENADSEKLFGLTGQLARQLGTILEGAHFQPVEMDEVRVPVGEVIIEWSDVEPDSRLVGQPLEAADIRDQTGVSVIAIQRGDETISNPQPDEPVQAGDILVTLGSRDDQHDFEAFGYTLLETMFLAGVVYISSSAVITKSLIDEGWVANPESSPIPGTLVFEDLLIAVSLAVLSAVALGEGAPAGD
jgi:TrkA domain protein